VTGWKQRFNEPIKLPDGRKLVTLRDAIAWFAKEVPKSEHKMKQSAGRRGADKPP
jgi:hypothetical protein